MTRSGAGVVYAVRDGVTRVASAPAVLAGTVAVVLLAWLPPHFDAGETGRLTGVFPWWMWFGRVPLGDPALASAADSRTAIAWLLLGSFAAGGILDRYARNRPTRGRGFFGACGAHFPPMLRLGIGTVLIDLAIFTVVLAGRPDNRFRLAAAVVACLAVHLVAHFARVRLVVEDRRSAIGAWLAGWRFARRHAATVGLYVLFSAAAAGGVLLYAAIEPPADGSNRRMSAVAGALFIALDAALMLVAYASAVVLFQARLAHAEYTAAPPIVWPESPAAEAIANGSPSLTP